MALRIRDEAVVVRLREELAALASLDLDKLTEGQRDELRHSLVELRPRIDDLIRWLASVGA